MPNQTGTKVTVRQHLPEAVKRTTTTHAAIAGVPATAAEADSEEACVSNLTPGHIDT